MLIDAIDNWLRVDGKSLSTIKNIIDDLHQASLIMDDVEDRSPMRRGSPAAHCIFGVSQSINTATYATIRVISQVADLGHGEMVKPLVYDLERLFVGQSWDLYWTFHMSPPTEEEYMQMVDGKTGGLFQAAIRLMLFAAMNRSIQDGALEGISATLFSIARLFGRFFQIRDDYLNLTSEAYGDRKGRMEDLDEGKFSYPLILTLANSTNTRDQIMGLLKESQRPLSQDFKQFILQTMESTGALSRTVQMIHQLHADIEAQIDLVEEKLGENPGLRSLMDKLRVKSAVGG